MKKIFACFKTFFIRCTRASVSAMTHGLGNKSKKYCRMRDMSFWKLHENGFAIFSWGIAAGAKGGLMVLGVVWDVAVAV